jgi:chaperonin GroES
MRFIPLYDQVLIQPIEGPQTAGPDDRFVMAEIGKEDFKMGTVVAVGIGYRKDNGEVLPLATKKGMLVMFGPYAGTKITVGGEAYLTMSERELKGWICSELKPCGACEDCTRSDPYAT